jgi:ribosomal protein S18 acetylase RimI-like enzyme
MSTVFRATPADLMALVDLHQLVSTGHGPEALTDLMHLCDRGLVLCAETDGQPCGLATGMVAAEELEIHMVVVHAAARRAGLGHQLLCALESAAISVGASGAFLEVRASNGAARALYTKAGYIVSRTRASYYRDGEDAILMHRHLETRCGD